MVGEIKLNVNKRRSIKNASIVSSFLVLRQSNKV